MVECAHDVGRPDVGRRQTLESERQRSLVEIALLLDLVAQANEVPVFGDVREVREVAERPDHIHRLVGGQVLQEAVERAPGLRIALQAKADRQLPNPLDELESLLALLLADHIAEDAAEQADVFDQRAVLVGGSGGNGFLGHGSCESRSVLRSRSGEGRRGVEFG